MGNRNMLNEVHHETTLNARACLKIHFRHLLAPLRNIFGLNSLNVARYAAIIWAKSPIKCNAHLTKGNFQTRSSLVSLKNICSGNRIKLTNFGDDKMEFRLARMDDLEELKAMYRQIVKNMNDNNIQIWDNIYPCDFFVNDIKDNQMYVLIDKNEIISAFVLCNTNTGAKQVQWNENLGKSIYLDRLGVNIKYGNKGIGTLMIEKAKKIAKSKGFDFLRLFVVDINIPAINLYVKNGFIKAEGIYDEVFDDGFVLHEYGYEIEV